MLVCTLCVPSLTPISRTVATLPYDFTDEEILTDEVSTARFVAARLSPFKVYRAPIVRTPGDVTSRQESKPARLSGNLAVILQRLFIYYYCLCLKSHTFIFFFLLGLDMFILLSSHGSSLIGLPFPPSCCFRPCDVCSVLIYLDVSSDLVRGDAQYFVSNHAVGDFRLSFFVDRRGERTCFDCYHNCVN